MWYEKENEVGRRKESNIRGGRRVAK